MPYFQIMHGLRGCYLPDSSYIIRATTRRELKSALESEARDYRDAGFVGASKRNITRLASQAWRNRKSPSVYGTVLPLAPPHARDSYCQAFEVCNASRAEFKQWQESTI